MTKAQLVERALALGLVVPTDAKKADVEDILREAGALDEETDAPDSESDEDPNVAFCKSLHEGRPMNLTRESIAMTVLGKALGDGVPRAEAEAQARKRALAMVP